MFSIETIQALLFIPIPILILKKFRDQKKDKLFLIGLSLLSYFSYQEKLLMPYRDLLTCIMFVGFFHSMKYNHHSWKQLASEVRPVVPLYLMILFYPFIPSIIKATNAPDFDLQIQQMDQWLFQGQNPSLMTERFITPWLSEWMAFSYTFYGFAILAVFALLFLKNQSKALGEFVFMICLCLSIGYSLYAIFPVQGPVFAQKFSVNLDLFYMEDVKNALMDKTRIERDCFPSLHTAISMVCLYSAWNSLRPLFWVMLPVILSIPFACVYLRYHYVTDVIAGIILAIMVILIRKKAEYQPLPK